MRLTILPITKMGLKALKTKTKTSNKLSKKRKFEDVEDVKDDDDKEIARLEKLLGITSKEKSKSASKLNKEYEQYEGIGGNFGDFLMDLDDLTNSIKKKKLGRSSKEDYTNSLDGDENLHHLLDDDEQEVSDIEYDKNELEDEDISEGSQIENDSESQSGEDDIMSDSKEEDGSMLEEKEEESSNFYKPSQGEDVYGRVVDVDAADSTKTSKYIPPALRKKLTVDDFDESSDNFRLLKRQINGLMNKVSEQTKDKVFHDLQQLFNSNSLSLSNLIFKESLFTICKNASQMVIGLLPLYSCLIAALHVTVSVDIGANLIEKLVEAFMNNFKTNELKSCSNFLILLIYLYNFRVIHHELIMDLMQYIIRNNNNNDERLDESKVELILIAIDHCGFQLRNDDPLGLKNFIIEVNQLTQANSGRYSYLLECISDLKNNKSKRVKNSHSDAIKDFRKWIGSIKSKPNSFLSTHGTIAGDGCLRITLTDIMNIELKGRWWKAGASWKGNSIDNQKSAESLNDSGDSVAKETQSDQFGKERKKLEVLAEKLRMNTPTRKNIFYLLMTSNDVDDAYEKLSKLELKGKQDRDIVQVAIQCCVMEKIYNPFYSQLLLMFCDQNRQFKVTLQYMLWDIIKSLNDDDKKSEQKAKNLAKLMTVIISSFTLSITTLKIIDITEMSKCTSVLMSELFLELFGNKQLSEDTFRSIFDRIATSSDVAIVREMLLVYFQSMFKIGKNRVAPEIYEIIRQRKADAISTLQSMKVLDFVKTKQERFDD